MNTNQVARTWKCSQCDFTIEARSPAALTPHLKERHGWIRGVTKKHTPIKEGSPLDRIHRLEHQIRQEVRELETERDQLHARIVEIDNIVAKYKKNGL